MKNTRVVKMHPLTLTGVATTLLLAVSTAVVWIHSRSEERIQLYQTKYDVAGANRGHSTRVVLVEARIGDRVLTWGDVRKMWKEGSIKFDEWFEQMRVCAKDVSPQFFWLCSAYQPERAFGCILWPTKDLTQSDPQELDILRRCPNPMTAIDVQNDKDAGSSIFVYPCFKSAYVRNFFIQAPKQSARATFRKIAANLLEGKVLHTDGLNIHYTRFEIDSNKKASKSSKARDMYERIRNSPNIPSNTDW